MVQSRSSGEAVSLNHLEILRDYLREESIDIDRIQGDELYYFPTPTGTVCERCFSVVTRNHNFCLRARTGGKTTFLGSIHFSQTNCCQIIAEVIRACQRSYDLWSATPPTYFDDHAIIIRGNWYDFVESFLTTDTREALK